MNPRQVIAASSRARWASASFGRSMYARPALFREVVKRRGHEDFVPGGVDEGQVDGVAAVVARPWAGSATNCGSGRIDQNIFWTESGR